MKSATCTLGVSWIFAAMTLQAQGPRADPLAEHLFPPDLVLQLQSEIGLTDEQRDAFRAEMEKAQPRFEAFNQLAPNPPPAAIVSRAEKIKAGVEEWQGEGSDPSTPKARAASAKNPEALRAEVQSLIDTSDVPWRQITWESCLLEGLKRSREARKPLLLWVFIDRPADDRRC